MQQNTHKQRSLGTKTGTPNQICWGQMAAAFQKVGVSVRGLLSWMHVVTSGKVTLGDVMVKGRGVMENGCRNGSSRTIHGHVL